MRHRHSCTQEQKSGPQGAQGKKGEEYTKSLVAGLFEQARPQRSRPRADANGDEPNEVTMQRIEHAFRTAVQITQHMYGCCDEDRNCRADESADAIVRPHV